MYDFDKVVNRRNTYSLKWNVEENELPMWVADMDFQTAPEIIEALSKRVNHGVFGYSIIPDEWAQAYESWWRDRHNLTIESEWLVFCTGVIPAISSTVRKITTPGENVVVQTPVYDMFFNSTFNNGRNVLENKLIYENGQTRMDFEDLEEKLKDPQTSLMILCNPQNPAGKIWDKETLEKVGHLCKKYNVVVLADEIHCDIVKPGKKYIPFASVSEECKMNSITCLAPTKAFNIAGIQSAAVMIPNDNLRHKIWRALNTDEVAEPNAFAMSATIAAFTQGGAWLDALNEYIQINKDTAKEFIEKEIPQIKLMDSEATYLLWIDISEIAENSTEYADFIRSSTGLYITDGSHYRGNGSMFVRMNVACCREALLDGLNRLKRGTEKYCNR